MNVTRMTLFFQQTTAPTQGNAAARTGGWSESLYTSVTPYNPFTSGNWLRFRSFLLPPQASIVGARAQIFQITGNRITPLGSTIYRGVVVGSNGNACDVPQIALQVGGAVTGAPNSARFTLRGIPDNQIVNGEFSPNPNFTILISQYLSFLSSPTPFGMVARDLSQVAQRVNGIAAGQLTTQAALGGVANNATYVRFLRVLDDAGKPITGSFLVTNGAGTTTLTLQGMTHTLTHPNGLARVDALAYYPFSALNVSRCVVRKVGRPFVQYRGRASASR